MRTQGLHTELALDFNVGCKYLRLRLKISKREVYTALILHALT